MDSKETGFISGSLLGTTTVSPFNFSKGYTYLNAMEMRQVRAPCLIRIWYFNYATMSAPRRRGVVGHVVGRETSRTVLGRIFTLAACLSNCRCTEISRKFRA